MGNIIIDTKFKFDLTDDNNTCDALRYKIQKIRDVFRLGDPSIENPTYQKSLNLFLENQGFYEYDVINIARGLEEIERYREFCLTDIREWKPSTELQNRQKAGFALAIENNLNEIREAKKILKELSVEMIDTSITNFTRKLRNFINE